MMYKRFSNHCCVLVLLMLAMVAFGFQAQAKKKKDKEQNDTIKSGIVSGLKWRGIGPALASGRISDIVVHPEDHSIYYVGIASGNIWKTTNGGTTFSPVFDKYGSYSIGCLAMDPGNPHTIWAGTGENNHQRSVSYGDGVYKSEDGGKSWKHKGLENSRHIGNIIIDPRSSDVVYVAAEGSLWGEGGDRGLYKTIDGGETWEKVLEISEHTGVNNVVFDPRDPDVIYATSEQRRRHVFTKIGGGPESAIYKSTDGGNNWEKLTKGLPSVDMGGIGIAVSPVNPDVVYAIIEAAEDKGGFFRSTDRGASWSKMSSHHASGQYYNEIYCDPKDVDKVYSMETISKVTEDGGKTWKRVGNKSRHVDDHALWIDPEDTEHFLIGSDGGLYETFDGGSHFKFMTNLPVTQFYRVAVDDSEPFYWVYGGTQDNSSLGGPSRNTSSQGVNSYDWIVTLGGDGFWQAIEPGNPDIVYSEYQYGNIYRYDKKSGERLGIKPQPDVSDSTFKWNWNTPFIISPHSPTRLYIGANYLFRSDNRGNSWRKISGDLTRKIDRNTWPVMGRYWSIDAVAKDVSTSLFGTIISLAESPVQEDLIYVGTDDGLIQITEDAGETWRKVGEFPDVPEYTYVSDIMPSKHDANVVYASFDNRKRDDFKPYILKSEDKGRTWGSIAANLPEDETIHTLEQDHVKEDLLFAGSEFGVYFSVDGGKIWTRLKSGIPTISVRDMVIQERENDLVVATFGRGFYILHDYTPLRDLDQALLDKEAHIFPVKDALMYVQTRGYYGQGSMFWTAGNPDFGATITYYIKEVPKTLKQERKKKEKALIRDKKPVPIPAMDALRAEEKEISPYLIFTIYDRDSTPIKKITKRASKGIKRLTWNLRYPSVYPVSIKDKKFDPLNDGGDINYAMPGTYYVDVAMYHRGEVEKLAGPVEITAKVLQNTTLPAEDREAMVAFEKKVGKLIRAVYGADRASRELMEQVQYIRQAILRTPELSEDLMAKAVDVEEALDGINWKFHGQDPKASREENWPAPPSIYERMNALVYSHWSSTSAITETQRNMYKILSREFPPILEQLKEIKDVKIQALQDALEKAEAPWTPGRIPEWEKE
ncbi:MAG: hypothetical protein R6T99_00830 [Bacteroidales bacterium]